MRRNEKIIEAFIREREEKKSIVSTIDFRVKQIMSTKGCYWILASYAKHVIWFWGAGVPF